MFWVNVPVLSEKMYEIIPSSSFKLDDYTLAVISFVMSYSIQSYCMKYPYANFTISSVTSSEIETKFISAINHSMNEMITFWIFVLVLSEKS
jgi:hypothetical protein